MACLHCGHDRRKVLWETAERQRLIARCLKCGELFHGEKEVPAIWALRSPRGFSIGVDGEVDAEKEEA